MQNSEAVQAWFQGMMASFRILGLVSKNKIRSREFSFSSRCLRVKIINLDLVSMPETEGHFIGYVSMPEIEGQIFSSRLDVRDWIGEILILMMTKCYWMQFLGLMRQSKLSLSCLISTKFSNYFPPKFRHSIGWISKICQIFSPKLITKFGDSPYVSPNLVINWSPNLSPNLPLNSSPHLVFH